MYSIDGFDLGAEHIGIGHFGIKNSNTKLANNIYKKNANTIVLFISIKNY
jgi:hypothetical protein